MSSHVVSDLIVVPAGCLRVWWGGRPRSCLPYLVTEWAPSWCGRAPRRGVSTSRTSVSAIRAVRLVRLWLSVMARVSSRKRSSNCLSTSKNVPEVKLGCFENERMGWKAGQRVSESHPKHEEGSVLKAKYQKNIVLISATIKHPPLTVKGIRWAEVVRSQGDKEAELWKA